MALFYIIRLLHGWSSRAHKEIFIACLYKIKQLNSIQTKQTFMQTPLQLYYQLINDGKFQANILQEQVMMDLQRVYDELISTWQETKKPWSWLNKKIRSVKGLYLWGGVGIGKTWLMDIFYENLPIPKLRLHFHRFMQQIHVQLKQLQGEINPLQKLAKQLAKQTRLICLDEFLVNDITDAMLLANLLTALFAQGITLITTANVAPDDLYRNGLQRGRFIPAIELIKKYLNIFHLTSDVDYRLRALEQAGTYFYPLNDYSAQCMQNNFLQFTHDATINYGSIEINGREIKTLGYTSDVIWFDFNDICQVPRSQLDYLEISRCFSTVLISNIYQISAHQDNIARYLINLVDVFYDAHVKLILSAAKPVGELYPKGRLSFEFARTHSRLLEMQSYDYLQKEHLAL